MGLLIMGLDTILILLSSLLIGSFFYNFLLDRFQIPPVLLLITTGIILKAVSELVYGQALTFPRESLALFGTLGLITIVLEAVLDLKIAQHNYRKVAFALLGATLTIIISVLAITFLIYAAYPVDLRIAFVYATPLSIVSSAIVIPSIAKLTPQLKEFLVFESIFSDIVGVLAFNFLTLVDFNNLYTLGEFSFSLVSMLVLSAAVSIPLALVMNYSKRSHQHIFILAILVFMYAVAKHFHLSALILILIFGLLLNNIPLLFSKTRFKKLFDHQSMQDELDGMQKLTGEFAFIIRTFFFVLFGYSINLALLANLKAIWLGLSITLIIYLARYLSFRGIRSSDAILNSLIAPRGLITVLLFYQIPDKLKFAGFDQGIIFLVVILSSLIMSVELIHGRKISQAS